MLSTLRRSLDRVGRWPRLALAGACLLMAGLTAAQDAQRPASATAPVTVAVVVAARALPAGHTLRAVDLRVDRWPARCRPVDGASRVPALVGRRTAGPLAAGDAISPRRLVDAGLTAGLLPGTVAVPVDLDADVRGLVGVGALVDLVAVASPDSVDPSAPRARTAAQTVAQGVLVLALLLPGTDARGAGAAISRVVLAVDRATALRIAGLRATRMFTIVLDAP